MKKNLNPLDRITVCKMFEKVSSNVRPIHGKLYMENGQILVDNLYGLYALKDE